MIVQKKIDQVATLQGELTGSDTFFLFNFTGCSCEDFIKLRVKLRECEAQVKVVKNKLARIAIRNVSDSLNVDSHLTGPTALVYGKNLEPVGVAKVLLEFVKDKPAASVKGGVLEGQTIDAAQLEVVSSLPSRTNLQAQVAGVMVSMSRSVVCVLSEPGAQLVRLLSEWVKKRES